MEDLAREMLAYFSIPPQVVRFTGRKDSTGGEVTELVANGFISKAGFCARHGMSERQLDEMVASSEELRHVAEVCNTKFKYFVQVNGLTKGGWEAPFAIRLAEAELGYTSGVRPSVVVNNLVLTEGDRRMLERALGGAETVT